MKKFILPILLLLVVNISQAQNDAAFEKDIRHFLKINGSLASFDFTLEKMFKMMIQPSNKMTTADWDQMKKDVLDPEKATLVNEIVGIYKKEFTHDEIKAFIAFYESPAGKKLSSKTPDITSASMAAGESWGRKIGMKLATYMQEKGYR